MEVVGAKAGVPVSSESAFQGEWVGDLKKLELNLQDVIDQHTSKSSDRIRQAFRLFTAASNISPSVFHKTLCRLLNAKVPLDLCTSLFKKFDTDDSGDIDLGEFVNGLFPKDYTSQSWNVARENEERAAHENRKIEGVDPTQFLGKWTGDATALERRLQDVIMQHTSKSSDRVRQAYRLFTAANGISPKIFKEQVCKLVSANVPDALLSELFTKYDTDGSGDIDLQEFVSGLMPKDYTSQTWNAKRESELQKPRNRTVSEGDFQGVWTGNLAELQQRLQDTIAQHTSKSSDQCRQAFKMFTAAQGITPEVFAKQISKIMCAKVPKDLCMQLFAKFDTDGSGDIDLMEFMNGLMPQDYTENLWNVEREELAQKQFKKQKKSGLEMITQFRTATEHTTTWSMEELELRLQDKIMQRTSKSSDQFRQAFKLFTVAGGITPEMFHQQINKILGVNITKETSLKLFKKYDTDGSGDIDLSEFVNGIMPKDWEYVSIPVRKFPRLQDTIVRHVPESPDPVQSARPKSQPQVAAPKRHTRHMKPTTPKTLNQAPPTMKNPIKPKEAFRRSKPSSPAVRKMTQATEIVAEPQPPPPNQKNDLINDELWKTGKLDENRIANLTNLSRTLREQEKRDSQQGRRLGKACYKSRFSPSIMRRKIK